MAAQALRAGLSVEDIHDASKFDPWFIRELARIVDAERAVAAAGLPQDAWRAAPAEGARLLRHPPGASSPAEREADVAALRERARRACRSTSASTPAPPSSPPPRPTCTRPTKAASARRSAKPIPPTAKKIIILGGGPNRIGQGIEFDYCCVHAAYALKDAGFETIMVNCNPETVSTDYDTSDRLYFEPLTAEDVIALVRREQQNGTLLGCIVQYGGQTPLKLSQALAKAGIPILGTSADAIDIAEDRERFQQLLHKLGLRQPENGIARSAEEAEAIAERIGYPVVIRPSYVLGGRAMEIVYDRARPAPLHARGGARLRRQSRC